MSEQETLLFIQRLGAPLPLLADNTYTNVPFIYPYHMYTHPHPILTLQQASGLFSSLMQKKGKRFWPM